MPSILLLLAACSPPTGGQMPAGDKQAIGKASEKEPAGTLSGLYEGGGRPQRDRLCLVDRGDGTAHFGLVVWGDALHGCSGIGTALRTRSGLRLIMAGDSPCAIEASMQGGAVRLARQLPSGCAYYCGAQASLSGARFARIRAGKTAALEARDMVGDSLCAAR